MSIALDTPVADLVTDKPARARIFERLDIDYCCGGDHSLAEACRKKDLDPDTVVQMLDVASSASSESTRDWSAASLSELIDHIVSTHHDFLRDELPRLDALLTRVTQAHGQRHPWLRPTLETFLSLKDNLESHMASEEKHVFPTIRRLATSEHNRATNGTPTDGPDIEQMIEEHDEAARALESLRCLTSEYTPPEDACPKFRAALDGLHELEQDMHRHVHKENNILFPRARRSLQ